MPTCLLFLFIFGHNRQYYSGFWQHQPSLPQIAKDSQTKTGQAFEACKTLILNIFLINLLF